MIITGNVGWGMCARGEGALASQVISEAPFEPIREETYDRAAEVLASCGQVICCLKEFGTLNDMNRKLAELGRDKQGTDLLV